MKKHILFSALFALFVCSLSAQTNNIWQSGGISQTVGAPTYKPGAKGNIVAIDTVTGIWYVSRDRYAANGNWLSMGQRIEQISGCSAPAYTPNKYNSDLVINNCAVPELYYHSGGGVWVQLNASGSTYTAGTGIAISGSNVISNTAPDQTVSLTGAGGNVITGTYPSFTITGTPATGAETIVTAGTGASVTGTGTSGSPYVVSSTITQYTDETAQDAVGAMVGNTLTYTDATPLLDVKTQMSITSDASGVKLSGDAASPGNSKLYGTDGSGVKGWQSQPTGTTDLSISGSSSPLTINSSTGTDITATAGTGISLAGTSGNMTITNTGDTNASDDITGTIASTQVAYGSGTNTIAGNANLTWDGTALQVGTSFIKHASGATTFRKIGTRTYLLAEAGNGTTTATSTVGIGYQALLAATNLSSSVAIGEGAYSSATSGGYGVAIGHNALKSTTTLGGNIAIGYEAGYSIVAPALPSTLIGYQAGKWVTGYGNVAIGENALTGISGQSACNGNVAIGRNALKGITSGGSNVAIGANAGLAVTTGTGLFALGQGALQGTTSATYTIAIGENAGGTGFLTGAYSVFIGNETGQLGNGDNNVFIGYQAGRSRLSSNNVFLGANTGAGPYAGVTNTGYDNVMMGVYSGTALTTGYRNISLGSTNLSALTTGNSNIAIGYNNNQTTTTGSGNITIGATSPPSGATVSNELRIGSAIYGTTVNTFGSAKIGIGVVSPAEVLSVAGNLQLTTAGNKLKIATGSNASIGTSTLVAGTVTVSTTAVATGSHIVVCYDTPAGTLASGLSAPTASIVNATSFVINSLTTAGVVNTLDTSSVRWWIIN
jgi:hypothetical protein